MISGCDNPHRKVVHTKQNDVRMDVRRSEIYCEGDVETRFLGFLRYMMCMHDPECSSGLPGEACRVTLHTET